MIEFSALIGIIFNFALGWQCLRLMHWQTALNGGLMVRIVLAYLLGQLLTSLIYYVMLLLWPNAFLGWILVELLLVCLLAICGRTRQAHASALEPTPAQNDNMLHRVFCYVTWCVVFLGLVAVLLSVRTLALKAPYGLWDAAAMWNLRVVYLAHPTEQWQQIFSSDTQHPDYPLFHSLSAARLCVLYGQWNPLVTQWFGFAHGAMAVLMLVGVLMRKASIFAALLAGAILLGTQYWWGITFWQYADHTLCAYMTASAVLLYLWLSEQDIKQRSAIWMFVLLALMTGTCAWTKNEGWPWVFWVSLIVGVRVCVVNRSRLFPMAAVWCGALTAVLWMPLSVHLMADATNDMVTGISTSSLTSRLFDWQHTCLIFEYVWDVFLKLHPVWALLLSIVWVLTFRPWQRLRQRLPAYGVLLLISLQILTYLLVYQLTPHDLDWHLGTSVNRLMLQVWPIVVLGLFLLARSCPVASNTLQKNNN
ncbi:MAG: hypothetical protein JKX85_10715 [Phycisphaeraceae bacterium]|nr:hypothetical protein [Phycisphaeraceae bacterium]